MQLMSAVYHFFWPFCSLYMPDLGFPQTIRYFNRQPMAEGVMTSPSGLATNFSILIPYI